MKLFWLHDDRKTFRTQVDEQYDHLQRFENLESKIQGQIADILDVLPSRFADTMTNNATWLSQTVSLHVMILHVCVFTNHAQFRNAMMTQRSNTSTRVRRQAGPSIFDCAASDLKSPQVRYEKFRERIGWIAKPDGRSGYETWAVEILHKDYNGSFDIN